MNDIAKRPTGPKTALVRRVETHDECGIIRTTTGYAYPRSGNAHNPTPRYIWTVVFKGRTVGYAYNYRQAVDLAEAFDFDPEW